MNNILEVTNVREIIAKRCAFELGDNEIVNIGIGIPTLVPKYVDCNKNIIFQSDNGALGITTCEDKDEVFDSYYANPAGEPIVTHDYGCYFDALMSFDMIGGGHLDTTILGALQVDSLGGVANWKIPGKFTPGMGGAMDLVTGAKRVIITMEHMSKGNFKILDECTFPLTGKNCVDTVVTELCVLKVTKKGFELNSIKEGITLDELKEKTKAKLIIPKKITNF